MIKNQTKDFTSGSLADRILFFSLPIAASSILQQLFNAADTAVVGRFAGSEALAAVGANSTVTALFVNVLLGLSIGANVQIAQAIGAREKERISDTVHTSVLFAILSGLALMLIGIPVAGPLLRLMGTPDNVLAQAVLYLRIYLIGMPLIVLYNFSAAILRAKGDTKRPMYALIFAGVINVLLNLLLVIVFHLGVAGVAIATVLSSGVSCTIVTGLLCREKEEFHLRFHALKIRGDILKQIIVIGGPSSLQGLAFSLSNVCIQSGINSFGSDAVAGVAAESTIEAIDYFLVSAFTSAAMTFTGQNFGAGKLDRCRRIALICLAEAVAVVLSWECIFFLLRNPILHIFTTDTAVLAYAYQKMWYVVLPHFMISGYEILAAGMRGMGHSLMPALLSIFGTVAFRLVWVFAVFPHIGTFGGLLIVYILSWVLTNTLMVIAYIRVFRTEKKKLAAA